MSWMLRNSRNRPDALLTFSAGAVAVVLVKVLLNGVVAHGITFGSIDGTLAGLVLGATLGAYTGKRITVDKGQGVEVAPHPPRGYVLPGLAILVLLGLGIYLFAMAHRGLP